MKPRASSPRRCQACSPRGKLKHLFDNDCSWMSSSTFFSAILSSRPHRSLPDINIKLTVLISLIIVGWCFALYASAWLVAIASYFADNFNTHQHNIAQYFSASLWRCRALTYRCACWVVTWASLVYYRKPSSLLRPLICHLPASLKYRDRCRSAKACANKMSKYVLFGFDFYLKQATFTPRHYATTIIYYGHLKCKSDEWYASTRYCRDRWLTRPILRLVAIRIATRSRLACGDIAWFLSSYFSLLLSMASFRSLMTHEASRLMLSAHGRWNGHQKCELHRIFYFLHRLERYSIKALSYRNTSLNYHYHRTMPGQAHISWNFGDDA